MYLHKLKRELKMKALILAAGKGSRLKEKTADKPKALVEVCGKPILYYQLTALKKNGIKDVVIVTGYEADKIEKFVKSVEDMNIKLINNPEYETTNSSYSFWLARDEIKNYSYIHMNCDIICHPALLRKIKESKYDNIIGINKNIKLDNTMEKIKMNGDKIIDMELSDLPGAVGRAIGIAKFSPNNTNWMLDWVNERIKQGDKNQHCYGIIRKAVHELDYYGLDTGDRILADINTLEDLEKANKEMKRYLYLFD